MEQRNNNLLQSCCCCFSIMLFVCWRDRKWFAKLIVHCVCYICLFYSSAAALVSVLWPAWSSCAALALVIVTALLRNNFQIILMGKFVCLASVLTNFHLHTYFSGIYSNFLLMSGCELTLASLLFFHGLFFCELHFRCHQLLLNTALCSWKKNTFLCKRTWCSAFRILFFIAHCPYLAECFCFGVLSQYSGHTLPDLHAACSMRMRRQHRVRFEECSARPDEEHMITSSTSSHPECCRQRP